VSALRAGQAVDQLRRGVRVWRTEGPSGTAQRVARLVYRRLDAAALEFPLLHDDVADSRRLRLPVPEHRPDPSRRLNIGWVCSPPGLGSGGHTTMFRMVEALESAGHTCMMFLYDRYGDDVRRHEATLRRGWPSVRARVADARQGIRGVDACVATSWQTAHVLAVRGSAPMRRLYFVQDFEPFFYPRGAEYALAEDTYRFGFRCITVGQMLPELLRKEVGVAADSVEFGCDTEVYQVQAGGSRDGVVFYGRPEAARRGFILGLLALEELHRQRPDVPIHLIGDSDAQVPFPAIRHGVLSPPALSDLYNRTRAGLALSFTNISLIPEELLACGTVPVMNDSPYARAIMKNEHVRWAPPTPSGLADALLRVLDDPPDAARIAASARGGTWRRAQAAFVAALEDEVYADL
jgi:O-antigen biosynthesis protein